MPAAFLPVLFRYVAAAHRDTIQQYISNAYILHYNEIFGKMVANVFLYIEKYGKEDFSAALAVSFAPQNRETVKATDEPAVYNAYTVLQTEKKKSYELIEKFFVIISFKE